MVVRSLLIISGILFCSHLQSQHVLVLGVAQDGGFPHIGCQSKCQEVYNQPAMKRFVVSLAVIDAEEKKWYLFEATPDFKEQLQYFQELTDGEYPYLPEGIFLTHAHMGHYTGLMHLGREAMGANGVKVYTLPKFKQYLSSNGPWSQLVELGNIALQPLTENQPVKLGNLMVIADAVPHRDEFSETAAFNFQIKDRKYLFIPDIDKWEKWDRDIVEEVKKVDVALLDGSFFEDGELPNRPMSEPPHPFVVETLALFSTTDVDTKRKMHLIHFNHTNPLLWDKKKQDQVTEKGFSVAEQGEYY
jgi:pyrroloquinoline quinone biosynthesis protein B